jgi:hypothetical protein
MRWGFGTSFWGRRPAARWGRRRSTRTCGQLLDDLLEHAKHNVKASTEKIWKLVVEASLRPFFGHRKVATLSTAILKEYRRKRLADGRSEATCNRELSMLRTAFNLSRKCTPPKVLIVPYFPMVQNAPISACREIMNQTSICFRRFSRFSAALYRD